MARGRWIKPEFVPSPVIDGLSFRAETAFVRLWLHCDDEGRCEDDINLITSGIRPRTLPTRQVARDLAELEKAGLIVRYEVGGVRVLQVRGWAEHQNVKNPTPSKLPPPPTEPLRSRSVIVTEEPENFSVGAEEPFRPSVAVAVSDAGSVAVAGSVSYAGEIMARHLASLDVRPPARVVGQLGQQIKALLEEGFDPDVVEAGVAQMRAKGYGPSALPAFVNGVVNPPAPKQSKASEHVSRYLTAAQQLREMGR